MLAVVSRSTPGKAEVESLGDQGAKAEYKGMNSFEWRVRMWESSIPMIKERPLQGYGLTSFKPMSSEFSTVGRNMGAHNAYLEILFETGFIGLSSFLAIFVSLIFRFYKNMQAAVDLRVARKWALMIAYVISYMLICSADNLNYYLVFNWYVWFLMALMLVSERFDDAF